MYRRPIIISLDGEFTGLIPGRNSLISLGAVAYDEDGNMLSRIRINMLELPESVRDYSNMRWWDEHPIAWHRATENAVPAEIGMMQFKKWIDSLPYVSLQLAYWGGQDRDDLLFLVWYWQSFVKVSFRGASFPFRKEQDINIKVEARRILKDMVKYHDFMIGSCFALGLSTAPQTHVADEDAERQGNILFALRRFEMLQNK
jgi:hypothetical protein